MSEPATRLGDRYELGEVLGRGGMAEVRRAHDTVLGRDVAIKVLRTTDVVDRARFEAEARLLARLSHPHVVTVLDAGVERRDDHVDQEVPWLALELVEGETLADLLARGPVVPARLAAVGAQVADALAHAHARGIVHRDVKPSNVLLDATGRARLSDFGIARLLDDEAALTMTGHAVGTAAYIAPEQVAGEAVTTASDVYALGLLLLEGLTGRRAFPGPAVEAALARLHRGPDIPASLPPGWGALVAACTARPAGDRPAADDVAARLRALASRDAVDTAPLAATETVAVPAPVGVGATSATAVLPAVPAFAPPPSPPRRRRRRGVVALAVLGVLAVLGAATLLGTRTGDEPAGGDEPSPASTSSSPAQPTSSPAGDRTVEPAAEPTTTAPSPSAPATTPAPAPADQGGPGPAGKGPKDKGGPKGGPKDKGGPGKGPRGKRP